MECYAVQLVNVNITKCSFEEFQELPTLKIEGTTFLKDTRISQINHCTSQHTGRTEFNG